MLLMHKPIESNYYSFSYDVTTKEMLLAVPRDLSLGYIAIDEFAFDDFRFDRLIYNYDHDLFFIEEYKSSRQDFLNDKKWFNYLNYCDHMTFICPVEVIEEKEIFDCVGLEYIFRWDNKQGLGSGFGRWLVRFAQQTFYMMPEVRSAMKTTLVKRLIKDGRIQ